MDFKQILLSIADVFMFKLHLEDEADGTPIYTPGSITWGIMLRTLVIIIISIIIISAGDGGKVSLVFAILIWLLAIYPGFQQFQEYYKHLAVLTEETMCGSCRHFDPTSQLCKIYDEHITKDYLPCEGSNWELKDIIEGEE